MTPFDSTISKYTQSTADIQFINTKDSSVGENSHTV